MLALQPVRDILNPTQYFAFSYEQWPGLSLTLSSNRLCRAGILTISTPFFLQL